MQLTIDPDFMYGQFGQHAEAVAAPHIVTDVDECMPPFGRFAGYRPPGATCVGLDETAQADDVAGVIAEGVLQHLLQLFGHLVQRRADWPAQRDDQLVGVGGREHLSCRNAGEQVGATCGLRLRRRFKFFGAVRSCPTPLRSHDLNSSDKATREPCRSTRVRSVRLLWRWPDHFWEMN